MVREIDVVCPTCSATVAMRISRTGFFQQNILWRFGLYPWKCGACGATFLSRTRGAKPPSRRKTDRRNAGSKQRRA